MAEIILYADEFPVDVWKDYCRICGVDSSASAIKIKFKGSDVEPSYEEEECEADYDEEEK